MLRCQIRRGSGARMTFQHTPTPAAARRWLRSLSETFTPVNCCTWVMS
jgi:hypothetical protein